jgi:hypothetical protein
MKLKLSDWASLAEIISAIALIISLIYVGIQVSDGTRAVRSASVNEASLAVQNWYLELGSNSQMSELIYRALMSKKPLEDHEEYQFLLGFHSLYLGFQNNYLMSKEGTLDASTRDAFLNVMLAVRDTPGFKRFWRQRKTFLHPEFVSYVDEILARDMGAEGVASMDLYRDSSPKSD